MKLYIIPFLLTAVVAVSYEDVNKEEWETFKQTHGKKYESDAEESYRMKVYKDNKAMIEQHNAEYQAGTHTYDMKMNHLGDMLHHEVSATMTGLIVPASKPQGAAPQETKMLQGTANSSLPASIDWRTKGAVTEAKDQGYCGSCWAFSSTGALESQYFIKTGKLISLSEQNLIDCSGSMGNTGCRGGLMDSAWLYVQQNGGIASEAAYPYEAKDLPCRYTASKNSGVTASGFVDIGTLEESLQKAIANKGPVSVAIDSKHASFSFYSSGVYYEPACTQTVDHALLAVGYGTDEKNNDYWIVKNSWSKKWGEQGFMRIARNKNNHCGIACMASYPPV